MTRAELCSEGRRYAVAVSGEGIPGRGGHRNRGALAENTGNSESFGLRRFLPASGGSPVRNA